MSVKTDPLEECGMRNAECGMRNAASRITHHASRITRHELRTPRSALRTSLAFTLLELLTVVAIMGIIAAIALPSIRSLKPNAKVAGTRQLLDAVIRARQLALSQRTTVYMAFVPTNFWADTAATSWNATDKNNAANLYDKQLVGYAYICLRSVGDQPGAHTPRYLSSWKTLPQGSYIPPAKLWPSTTPILILTNTSIPPIYPFSVTNNLPFPAETNLVKPYVNLPYIAFDGTGQLVSGQPGQPELIPVSEGSVSIARDPDTKIALAQPAQAVEQPDGNTTNNYSVVYIDRLTGRAHVERRKVQ